MKKTNYRNTVKTSTPASYKTKEEKEKKNKLLHARERMIHFFELYSAERAGQEFWEILRLALTNKQEEEEEADRFKTDDMIFFYEMAKEFFENVETLCQKKILKEKEKIRKLRLKYSEHQQGI